MAFFKNSKSFYIIFTYLVTVVLITFYAVWIYGLVSDGSLEGKDLVWSITNLIGWVIALFIVVVHLKKTQKDQRLEKKEEVRKSLEIDAFKEINKSAAGFASSLEKSSRVFSRLPEKLKLHIEQPVSVKFSKPDIDKEIDTHISGVMNGFVDFVQSVQANEMAVMKFNYLRDFIKFKGEDVGKKVGEFQEFLAAQGKKALTSDEGYREFDARCADIKNELSRMSEYLSDYRKEVMRDTLGDIFSPMQSKIKKEKILSRKNK